MALRRLVLPYLIVTLIAYGIGAAGAARWTARADWWASWRERRILGHDSGGAHAHRPERRPPAVTAPWGESHVPLHRPLIRSGRAVVYSPYSAPPGSSVDFLAWQMSRAVTAIYGSSESWESIRNRYLVVRDDGATGLAVPGFSYRTNHPGLPAPKAGGTFPLILFLVVVPYFFLIALYLRLQRTDHSDRGRLTIYWSIAGFLPLLWIMPFIATLAGWLGPGSRRRPHRHGDEPPGRVGGADRGGLGGRVEVHRPGLCDGRAAVPEHGGARPPSAPHPHRLGGGEDVGIRAYGPAPRSGLPYRAAGFFAGPAPWMPDMF